MRNGNRGYALRGSSSIYSVYDSPASGSSVAGTRFMIGKVRFKNNVSFLDS